MSREERFLASMFRRYYQRHVNAIDPPAELNQREFAFIHFGREGMTRHLGFTSDSKLKEYLKSTAPKHAYYSSAYYRYPDVENMDEKGWLGADLVFDIDADHIPTKCKEMHDHWICSNCGYVGKGHAPTRCPQCNNEKIRTFTWVCEKCIDAAKTEVEKLVDLLVDDLGFEEKDITLVFSGHRGFHLHIKSEKVRKLDQNARREIVDYIRGRGIEITYHIREGEETGWKRRIFQYLVELFLLEEEQLSSILSSMGLRRRVVDKIISRKQNILDILLKNPSLFTPENIISIIGEKYLHTIIEFLLKENEINIDERVTIDTKRLIRLPGTLHGKTGFQVKKVPISYLWDFNPIHDARVFPEDSIAVKIVSHVPEKIYGYEIQVNSSQNTVRVPLFLAVYLISNGGARLA